MQEAYADYGRPCELSAVIREGNLIKARLPVDLPAFCQMIVAALAVPVAKDSRADPPPPSASLLAGLVLEI